MQGMFRAARRRRRARSVGRGRRGNRRRWRLSRGGRALSTRYGRRPRSIKEAGVRLAALRPTVTERRPAGITANWCFSAQRAYASFYERARSRAPVELTDRRRRTRERTPDVPAGLAPASKRLTALTGAPACPGSDAADRRAPLDLARALVDLGDLRVAVVALDRELLRVAVAAEDLDRLRRSGGAPSPRRRASPSRPPRCAAGPSCFSHAAR